VNVTEPADTAVTTPALSTVARAGLLLTQVPPEVGDRFVVSPTQITLSPVIPTTGSGSTVTETVLALQFGNAFLVNVKYTVPPDNAVTTPLLVTVAMVLLLLAQVPPEVGVKLVVAPTQIVVAPVTFTTGKALIVTMEVASDTQPVVEFVKVKVAVPTAIPVTTPSFATVAMAGSLLAQVPPEVGDKVVVDPMQILLEPVILTTGNGFTVTGEVAAETHPVLLLVKLKTTAPPATPVTIPALVTVATSGSLLTQVPPLFGVTPLTSPTHMTPAPVRLTVGGLTTVIVEAAELVHPFASVTVTV
jgi:hypothetical protein